MDNKKGLTTKKDRINARRLKIKALREAMHAKDSGMGSEPAEEKKLSLSKQQILKSRDTIDEVVGHAVTNVTDVETEAYDRESKRRDQHELRREELLDRIEEELVACAAKNEEVVMSC